MSKKLPYLKNLDHGTRPQDDFFQHAAGAWIKNNPIPTAESSWGTFYVLRDKGTKRVHGILKELSTRSRVKGGSEAELIRNLYRSGMDIKKRNALKHSPIAKELSAVVSLTSHGEFWKYVFKAHQRGVTHLWRYMVGQDDKNSEQYIFQISQGGLSLPDRDYYLKNDERSTAIQKAFRAYVSESLVACGYTTREAKKLSEDVYSFEYALAKISMSRVDARDIDKVYHKMTLGSLRKKSPVIAWNEYVNVLGIEVKNLLVNQPDFFARLGGIVEKTPLSVLKAYLAFSTLDDASPFLAESDARRAFRFHGTVLQGRKTMKPLWKRVSNVVDSYLAEPVGKEYVARYFSPSAKKSIETLVHHLIQAYELRIKNNSWMSAVTKKRALKKLSQVRMKLGYPTKWRSYKGLRIELDDYYGNIQRIVAYEYRRMRRKLGKKVDRSEWHSSPQTVNAFYDPNNNEIMFPAGILQPPFFDPLGDPAINYGAMGAVIGHELTHGFDDSGAKFDGKGNYKNWWTARDKKEFEKRAQVLVRQFNQYKVGDLSVNGRLTLGENIADLGGLAIAYDAFQLFLKKNPLPDISGYTPEQRFFFGYALFETSHYRTEYARMLILVDPHAPSKFRVNGPFSNLEAFHRAFSVTPKDALYLSQKNRAAIW